MILALQIITLLYIIYISKELKAYKNICKRLTQLKNYKYQEELSQRGKALNKAEINILENIIK